jgi:transcriptional regulator with XRE-family HTH domain
MKRKSRNIFDKETLLQIGERIREARGKATQREFAGLIGVGRTVLANYEAGRRLPDSETVEKIASQAEISTIYLLTGQTPIPDFLVVDTRVQEEPSSFAYAPALAVFDRIKHREKAIVGNNVYMVWSDFLPSLVQHFESRVFAHAVAADISLHEAAIITVANILDTDEEALAELVLEICKRRTK